MQEYEKYYYLMNGVAEKELNDFYKTDPPPILKDYSKKIMEYDDLREKIYSFRNNVRK